jgi:hypothetical protein
MIADNSRPRPPVPRSAKPFVGVEVIQKQLEQLWTRREPANSFGDGGVFLCPVIAPARQDLRSAPIEPGVHPISIEFDFVQPIGVADRRESKRLPWLGQLVHPRDWPPILEIDPHGEIVAIDVECDVDILRMQIWTGRIMKTPDFAARQDQATNGVCIARSAFQPIPKVDCAQFVLVGPLTR